MLGPILDLQRREWPDTLIMGHDSLDTTKLYIQGTRHDLQQAVETITWT